MPPSLAPGALWTKATLRAERARLRLRARRKAGELTRVVDRTAAIRGHDILLFATLRNEAVRLPWFLDYYRRLGVGHFLFADNGSDDGGREYLAEQPDASVWTTPASYKRARFGMDWMNALLARHGSGHWVVVVDVDEFLVYPHMDTRPLQALTEWLQDCHRTAFGTMLLDMYAREGIAAEPYRAGEDPFARLCWFDAGNYCFRRDARYRNLWIQGGPRQRVFCADAPALAPALNKVPLVRWRPGMAYRSSTHTLLPRGMNVVYAQKGGEMACGLLLHAKFLDGFGARAAEEVARGEHYAGAREYRLYRERLGRGGTLWTPASTRLQDWRQLEELGLMSSGSWA